MDLSTDLRKLSLDLQSNPENLSQLSDLQKLLKSEEASFKHRGKIMSTITEVIFHYAQAGVYYPEEEKDSVSTFLNTEFKQTLAYAFEMLATCEARQKLEVAIMILSLVRVYYRDSEIEKISHFQMLVNSLVNCSRETLWKLARRHRDLAIYFLRALYESIPQLLDQNAKNIWETLIGMPHFEEISESQYYTHTINLHISKKRKRQENFDPDLGASKVAVDESSPEHQYKSALNKSWKTFLSYELPPSLYKPILKSIPKFVLPKISDPLCLSDFLLKTYEMGGKISVLSLSGLFILISKYGLECKQYYTKLYALLKQQLAQAIYMKPGFLKLVELSLSSNLLPAALVAAFVKLFLRYAIKGSYQLSVWAVGFTMNSIRTHPSLQKLLERGSNIDTYNINESEPLNSDALNSSLWEILLLKKHYSINIRDLLKDITKDPLMMPKLNLSELIRNTPEHTPPPIYAQDYINNLIHHT